METAHKLLLVEDEEELVSIVQTYFRDEGYEVRIALNGEEGLKAVRDFKPDVIVSDVKMARMDGFEFYEALQKLPEASKIPFVFLTIMDDRSSVERAKELGASGYITKPFDVEELHEKVRELMPRKA
ncbi:MAG: response regulator [Ignavibacteriales bacterium]|nr:response regulator [Ignavibacteriales bacterium]